MITIEAYRARIGCFSAVARVRRQKLATPFNSFRAESSNFFDKLQMFIIFVFIITLKFNINMAFLKLSLLSDGDVESNPGPTTTYHNIQRSVSGAFHQAHIKFGDTAGIQCSCNALYSICFSIIKKVSIWKSWDLDYILDHGDAAFKTIDIPRSLFMHELPNYITIENKNVDVEMLANYYGVLGQKNI